MKLLVTGGTGQLGRAVLRVGATKKIETVALDHGELDVCNELDVEGALDAHAPTVLINAAAYTAVDSAESEPNRAFSVNAEGALNIARACARRDITLLHVSTDYVFSGHSARPYLEGDAVAPATAYGRSKAAGEQGVLACAGVVVRTSWLFEERGPSFVHTILRLAAEREVLRVVDDQRGCPTWADDLAGALLGLAHLDRRHSIYHYCNDGATTWYGFASAILAEARSVRAMRCERIDAISTREYPTPARRPAYSVLDTSRIRAAGIIPPSWIPGMKHVVAKVLRS